MNKKQKAVLITGAAQRLGLILAQQCLTMGLAVIIHYRTSDKLARQWLKRHPAFESKVFFICAELTTDTAAIMDAIQSLPLTLVGLINNASIFTPGNLSDPNHFANTLAVNALAPLALCDQFCKQCGKGWIINITDAHIQSKNKRYQNYRISKQFLQMLTEQLAFLYAPHIRVNAIAPGALLVAQSEDSASFKKLAHTIPLGITGDTKGLCRACEYLINADSITGQCLYVDGGWHII